MLKRLRGSSLSLLGLLGGLIIWEILGRLGLSPAFPPLTDVLRSIVEVWPSPRFLEALRDSLTSVAISLPPAILLGVLLGLLMGRFKIIEWLFDTYVNIFLSLPLVALIPVLFLIFGLGRGSVLATIVIYTFFIVVVNTVAGVKTADPRLIEMAVSFGAKEQEILRRVVLPAALPLIFAGIRIATGRSIRAVIIAEQVIGLVGLGGLIQRLGGAFAVEDLYAVILFVGLLGLLSMETVRFFEQRAMPWLRHGAAGTLEPEAAA
jgi:NitT/TauT family transport system permease protein